MAEGDTLEVMGYTINPKNVTNPALRRVIKGRVCGDFSFKALFGKSHEDHTDYRDHSDEYSESSYHTDSNAPKKPYSEYSKYYDHHICGEGDTVGSA